MYCQAGDNHELVPGSDCQKIRRIKEQEKAGRPEINPEIEALIIHLAQENPGWGYVKIAGALFNLGYEVSDQTVENVLRKNGISPTNGRNTDKTWDEFIKRHQDVIADSDFLHQK